MSEHIGEHPQGARRYKPYSPQNFRARNHDTAHADDSSGQADDGPQINHPLVSRSQPEFIDDSAKLDELLTHLRAAGRFAYDSEFIGELTYVPKLCLIQVASIERVALIDPLADMDLQPFWELLCDSSIEKIVHAGQQDIEPVFRHISKAACNVFDTQISAGFIGLAYPVALSKLVMYLLGARLGKGLTFTHWDQRPLSAMQLRYAADDVRYLLAVRDIIGKQLDTLGHADWARAECHSLCDPAQYQFNAETNYLRIRGAAGLPARNQAVLRELSQWRDAMARDLNVPARSFLKDEILLDLGRTPVKHVDKLDRVRGLPRPVEMEHGQHIVAITAKALATPVENLPELREYEPNPQQRFRADALWSVFQCLCAGRSIDPNLVTSRQEIGELYRAISSNQNPAQLRVLTGWRREAVGNSLLNLMAGKLNVNLSWNDTLKSIQHGNVD